jgi:endonuclease-3
VKNSLNDVIKILKKRYRFTNYKADPFKVLITTLLSQRTKDEVTKEASKRLFDELKDIDSFLNVNVKKIEELIRPVGFYRIKAKRIKEIVKILKEDYNKKVPMQREELLKLPGVGEKTADCVLCFGYNKAVIPVDVHVAVIAKRLGIANEKDNYKKIKEKIEKLVKNKDKKLINALFVEFGKEICRTRAPKCSICPIKRFCKYVK